MTAREALERHCRNAVDKNMGEVIKDLTSQVVEGIGPVADALGKVSPTSFQILGERSDGDKVVFDYVYVGATSSLKLQSTWEIIDGRWMVVAARQLL